MEATTYRDDHTQLVPNRALAYDPKEKSGAFSLDVSYFEQTGDGAVHTSVLDLLKWDENFYSAQIGGKTSSQNFSNLENSTMEKLSTTPKGYSLAITAVCGL